MNTLYGNPRQPYSTEVRGTGTQGTLLIDHSTMQLYDYVMVTLTTIQY